MALQGIKLTNNFDTIRLEFANLMSYMENSLRTPLVLTMNIGEIQGQMQRVSTQARELGLAINSSMGGTSADTLIVKMDKVSTSFGLLGESAQKITRELQVGTNVLGETVQILDVYKRGTNELISSTATVTNNMKQTLAVSEKLAMTTENVKIAEINKLLTEEATLTKQITLANEKGLATKETELVAQKAITSAKLETAMIGLGSMTDGGQLSVEEKRIALMNAQKILEAEIISKKELETAEIQRQILLYQKSKEIQMAGLQQQYGSTISTAGVDKAKMAFQSLNATSLASLRAQEAEIDMGIKQVTADAKASALALRDAQGSSSSFFGGFAKMIPMMIGMTAMMAVFKSIKEGVGNIVELDSVITDLNMDMMTTKESAFDGLIKSSRALSIELGTNIKDIDDMMKIYANANTTTAEIMAKTRNASILTNISGMSADESTDAIQAIILQFDQFKNSSDDVAVQSAHVNDVLASVAGSLSVNFRKGVSTISEAVKVSGSVIDEAGISYEKYASIVGKVSEISRLSGETIGASMKTIASRISRANTGDSSAEEVSKTDKAYQSIGVSIRDAKGNFNDLDTTLTSLSGVWGGLSSVQRSYIAEQSAGIRQKAVFINMMDNYGASTKMATDAVNSQGLANAKNDIYLTSIEAKMKVLKSTMTAMWQGMISSDVLKGAVDGLIGFVKVFGNLQSIAMIAGTTLLWFKAEAIGGMIASMATGIMSAIGYMGALGALALEGHVVGATFLALGDLLALNPIGIALIAVSALVVGIKLLDSTTKDYQETIDSIGKTQEETTATDAQIAKYEELDKQMSANTDAGKDNTAVKKEMIEIQKGFAQSFKGNAVGYDSENKAIITNIDLVKKLNEQKKAQALIDTTLAYDKLKTKIQGTENRDDGVAGFLFFKKQRDMLMGMGETKQASNANDAMKPMYDKMVQYNELALQMSALGAKNVKVLDLETGAFKDMPPAVNADTKAKVANTNATKDNGTANQTSAEKYASAMAKVASVMQTAKGVIGDANGIMDKHAKSNEWDLDAIIKLSEKYPTLLEMLGNDADMTKELNRIKDVEKNTVLKSLQTQITANDETVNKLATAYGIDISNKDLSEQAKNDIVREAVLKRIASYQLELDAINAISSASDSIRNPATSPLQKYLLTSPLDPKGSNPISKYLLTGDNTPTGGGTVKANPNAKRTSAVETELERLKNQLKSLDTSSATYKKLKATSGNLEKYLQSAGDKDNDGKLTKDETAKKAEDALNKAFESALKGFDGRAKVATTRIAILNNELATTTDAKKAGVLNSQILSSLNQELAITKEKGAYIAREIASRKYTSEQLSDMRDKLLDIKQTESSIALEIRQKVVEAIKKASDTLIASYQKQIDMINAKSDAEDKTTETLKLQNQLIKDQLALKTAQEELNVRVLKDGKWTWEADQSAIKTAQEAVTATKADIVKDADKSKIDALNVLIKKEEDKQSKLTGYANGTDYVPKTGRYRVGENGEEEVILPQGAKVIPHNKLGSNSVNGNSGTASTKIFNNVLDDSSETKKSVKDLLNSVDESVQKFVKASPQYGLGTDVNIGQAITNNDKFVKKPIDTLISDVTSDLQNFVNGSKVFGRNTDKNIGEAITANSSLLTTPMNSVIGKVKSGIDTFVLGNYSSGKGIVTELGLGVTESSKDLTDIIKVLTDKVVTTFKTEFGIHSPSRVMFGIGEYLMEGLANGVSSKDINKFIQTQFDDMAKAGQGAVSGVVGHAVSGSLDGWLAEAMRVTGTDKKFLPALRQVVMGESGGRADAINEWDSNWLAGHPSKGVAQMIDTTFQANKLEGYDDIWNPIDNLISSIRYQISRYGSIANTPGVKSLNNGGGYVGYETGTDYVPKTDDYRINENGGEIVTLPQGAGVIKNEFTKNLMDWGKFNPNDMLTNMMQRFKMPDLSSFKPSLVGIPMGKGNTTFNIDHVVLPDVTDNDGFMDNLIAYGKTH